MGNTAVTHTWNLSKVAVLIPCNNEEEAIGNVVRDFRARLPDSTIYVYDNNSSDRTTEVAREAGAIVCHEPLQGKGNVVRRIFADIEADTYVLTDGDVRTMLPALRVCCRHMWRGKPIRLMDPG